MSMVIYRIDIRDVRTRDELHSKVAEVLPLPEYYGRNLDALLSGFPWQNGDISVASVKNEYTEFTITLPKNKSI